MTITQELQTLLNTKGEIRQAIIDKGVAVEENAPYDSYANKISQIASGSGTSSVAEYEYQEEGNLTIFPRQPLKAEDKFVYTYSPSIWHSGYDDNASTKYLEDTNEFAIYYYFEDVANLFDGNDNTFCGIGESYRALYFKFAKETKVSQIKLRVKNNSGYTATSNVHASNIKEKATTCEESNKVVSYTIPAMIETLTDVVIDVNQTYKYWGVLCSLDVYACEIIADGRVYTMTLKSANMTPTFKCYPDEHMQVITQDWYNGSDIVPSQTLIAKPYKDGGCLVNYTDDGKAVNLKMFYMKSNGELVGNIYNNFTVIGNLNVNTETGIVSGFDNDSRIKLPAKVATDNWSFAIRANYKTAGNHQGLFFDGTLDRTFGEINNSTQTMSSYITGSWTDGTVVLENGADYWFLFVNNGSTLKSYVKKDAGYTSCPLVDEMELNFTISDLSSFTGHDLGVGCIYSNENWVSYADISTASLVDNGVEVWNAATKVALKDIYVLAPDDNFTLEGYSEKTQVADMNIPAHSVPVTQM